MKTSLAKLTLISFASLGSLLAGQAPAPPAPAAAPQTHRAVDPQKQLNHLTRKLALTGDQQSQILPILTDRRVQADSINGDAALTQKQRYAKLKAVRGDSESRIRNILTDTQRAAYDQMEQQARDQARTRRRTSTAVQ